VAKGRNTSVKAEAISENVFYVVRTDRLEIGIMCALCYNYYCLALSDLAVLNRTGISLLQGHAYARSYPLNDFTHIILPRIYRGRTFRNKDKICARAWQNVFNELYLSGCIDDVQT
jgi:hypothetical protein